MDSLLNPASTKIPKFNLFVHMGRSHGGGDNFEKCSVKIIAKLNLSTNYIFHTRLTMSSIINS